MYLDHPTLYIPFDIHYHSSKLSYSVFDYIDSKLISQLLRNDIIDEIYHSMYNRTIKK